MHDKPLLLISRGGTGWVNHALSTHFTRERSRTVPLLKIIHRLSTDLSTDYPQSVRSLIRAHSVSRTRPEACKMSNHSCSGAGTARAKAAKPWGKGWPGRSGRAFGTPHAAYGALYAKAAGATTALCGTTAAHCGNDELQMLLFVVGSVSGVSTLPIE